MDIPSITFFWSRLSPFSQWHPSRFTLPSPWNSGLGDVELAHAEQHMMASKAAHFGDRERYDLIMATTEPRVAKELGRAVRPFDAAEWSRMARGYVRQGNLAKFSQNPRPQAALLATGETLLAEASPYDIVWGIGLAAHHPDARFPTRWRGSNWLGEVLMDVRAELRRTR
jgi:ribA/ribD-fused uncharacterized protein